MINIFSQTIVTSTQYPPFLEYTIKVFIKILQEGQAHFISEDNGHQLRKLLLEIIHRLPINEHLRQHVRPILSLMFKLLEVGNFFFKNEYNIV